MSPPPFLRSSSWFVGHCSNQISIIFSMHHFILLIHTFLRRHVTRSPKNSHTSFLSLTQGLSHDLMLWDGTNVVGSKAAGSLLATWQWLYPIITIQIKHRSTSGCSTIIGKMGLYAAIPSTDSSNNAARVPLEARCYLQFLRGWWGDPPHRKVSFEAE